MNSLHSYGIYRFSDNQIDTDLPQPWFPNMLFLLVSGVQLQVATHTKIKVNRNRNPSSSRRYSDSDQATKLDTLTYGSKQCPHHFVGSLSNSKQKIKLISFIFS